MRVFGFSDRYSALPRVMFILLGCIAATTVTSAETVRVRQTEGLVHGFLTLSTLEGEHVATGDLTQIARGSRVTNRLVFHFKDGSTQEETAVFTQRGYFRLISDHLVQKGPIFAHPMEVLIDVPTSTVTVHRTDDDGKAKVEVSHVELPADVSNGMVLTLLKNLPADTSEIKVSMLAVTPKPRLVKLGITSQGEEPFSVGGSPRKAMHYVVKIEIGSVSGLVAPLIGKSPPDIHVWILPGTAPVFVKSEGPLFYGGPIWRIELTSPVWPAAKIENQNSEK